MITPPRILAVTDLSAAGNVALGEAARHAKLLGADLAVVHAVPSLHAIRPLFPQRIADEVVHAAELPRHAEFLLRTLLEPLVAGGTYELFVEEGTTAEVALDVIGRWNPTLVVVGSPADGAVGAVGVVRHATMPVLVARASPPSRRVLAGTDFSDSALPAIRAAAEATVAMQGELTILHAIEPNPISLYGVTLPLLALTPETIREAAKHRLDETLRDLGIVAETEVAVGPPAAALIHAASSRTAELMVVATHGRSGVTRFLLGSVAESVIHKAPCSVLVVRLAS